MVARARGTGGKRIPASKCASADDNTYSELELKQIATRKDRSAAKLLPPFPRFLLSFVSFVVFTYYVEPWIGSLGLFLGSPCLLTTRAKRNKGELRTQKDLQGWHLQLMLQPARGS